MKRLVLIAAAIGVLMVTAQPVDAACNNARKITTFNNIGPAISYVYTPGVVVGEGGNGLNGSSITANLSGTFWAVGAGDPAPDIGSDSGTFPALEWMYVYPNYPATLQTTWANDTRIDGCIDTDPNVPEGMKCTAVQLTDVDPTTGQTVFAVLSAAANQQGDYLFIQEGEAPINLIAFPVCEILDSSRDDQTGAITVSVDCVSEAELDPGFYLSDDPACQVNGGGGVQGLVTGYQVFTMTLPEGSAPPTDFRREAWTPQGDPTPLGMVSTFTVGCEGEADVYISYALLNESGFLTDSVAPNSTRMECGANLAEPEQRIRPTRERTREKPPATRGR